jgi:hypothetical protein
VANEVIHLLGDPERFCFHVAADMDRADAEEWIVKVRKKALANARKALAPLTANNVRVCAIVAKDGDPGTLDHILASHPRVHTAEGCLYRDVVREACGVPAEIVVPKSLDVSKVGKLSAPPWGKDQKLAALAAWTALRSC